MNKLIFANLIHRPLRSIISVLAVAIEVVMILSIVAIFMGMLNDQKQRTNGIGADLVVSPSNASFMNGMSGAAMSAKLAPFLATLPHVAVAAPVIQNFSMGDSLEILYGIDYKSFDALKPFKWVAGGPFQGPDDVIVDDIWAKTDNGHHVGETVTIQTLHHDFHICGIVESGKGGRSCAHRNSGRADRHRWQGLGDLHQEPTTRPTKTRSARRSNLRPASRAIASSPWRTSSPCTRRRGFPALTWP